jgi:hypothetical protein
VSNPLAIAAVTATLRNLLTQGITADPDLADATVTMQPLDRARANGNVANQLNIFLYHVLPSAAWRNMDYPGRVNPGETAQPPLGLNLYYLLTAFGRDNDTLRPFGHQVIGRAMSVLNDHPLLGSAEIKAALPNNDLWQQVERVRFTMQPFSLEEIAKLWTGFQTQYRLSVAYEAAVVLIESTRTITAPLPVLMRAQGDTGVLTQTNLVPPFPTLEELTPPNQQPAALQGDTLTLTGHNLTGTAVTFNFSNVHLTAPIPVPAQPGATDTQVAVQLPKDPVNWPAGMYTVSAVISNKGQPDRTTNDLPLALAPEITNAPLRARRTKAGAVTIRVTCVPEVRPEQRVSLLLGSQEVPAPDRPAQTADLSFVVPAAVPGQYWIRLRVDGVDSQLVNRTTTPPAFDPKQKVVIS